MIDVTKFEGLQNERWRYFDTSGMIRTTDFTSHIADVRGFGELMKHGMSEALRIQDLRGELLAAAPELLAEVLKLRERVKELEVDAVKYQQLMDSIGNMPTEHHPIWDSRNVGQ